MADKNPFIEVPVTSQVTEVYYFECTPELLADYGVTKAEELNVLIQNGVVDPFDIDGEWDGYETDMQEVHSDWSRVC